MSTLKVDAIRHNSATSDAITTAADGTCTARITGMTGGGQLSHRNKVINGAMTISQRGTSFSSASNAYHLDRFFHNGSNDGAVTISQSTTSPDGFANSYKVDVTTADTSIAATQYIQIYQRIEAQNLQDLAFGTSAAKTITVSFYVRSNLTGTYTFAMQQPDSSYRMMSQTYTINSANTWERKTFTVVGDTSGGINNDNGDGLNLFWNLAIGSNYTTGSSSSSFITYAQTNFAAGHTANILSSTSNEFYLTGVQLEVGDTATSFEHRSYQDELMRCYRYFYAHSGQGVNGSTPNPAPDTNINNCSCQATTSVSYNIPLPVPMRVVPTLYSTVTGSTRYRVNSAGANTNSGSNPTINSVLSTHNMVSGAVAGFSGLVAGQAANVRRYLGTGILGFQAEL